MMEFLSHINWIDTGCIIILFLSLLSGLRHGLASELILTSQWVLALLVVFFVEKIFGVSLQPLFQMALQNLGIASKYIIVFNIAFAVIFFLVMVIVFRITLAIAFSAWFSRQKNILSRILGGAFSLLKTIIFLGCVWYFWTLIYSKVPALHTDYITKMMDGSSLRLVLNNLSNIFQPYLNSAIAFVTSVMFQG